MKISVRAFNEDRIFGLTVTDIVAVNLSKKVKGLVEVETTSGVRVLVKGDFSLVVKVERLLNKAV